MTEQIVQTIHGPRRLNPNAPPPPPGYRRCFWCHEGLLIEDSDEAEAEHRWKTVPRLADPERWLTERRNDIEDDVRAEYEEAKLRYPAGGLAGEIASVRWREF